MVLEHLEIFPEGFSRRLHYIHLWINLYCQISLIFLQHTFLKRPVTHWPYTTGPAFYWTMLFSP